MNFAEKEAKRRSAANKRYQEKRKLLNTETIAQRRKRIAMEVTAQISNPTPVPFELLLDKEKRPILQSNVKDRIKES